MFLLGWHLCRTKLPPKVFNSKKKVKRKISTIGCEKSAQSQIAGRPGHSLSKTTEKGHLHKVFVRDIPTSGSRMSQEYPAQKLYVWAVFSVNFNNAPTRPRKKLSPAQLPKSLSPALFTVLQPQFQTKFQLQFQTSVSQRESALFLCCRGRQREEESEEKRAKRLPFGNRREERGER